MGVSFPSAIRALSRFGQRPAMDRDVAVMADDERLAPRAAMICFQTGGVRRPGDLEVLQFPDVVDVHPVVRSADLTGVREESSDKLVSRADVMSLERAVLDRGESVDLERHVAEQCYVLRPAVGLRS